MDRRKPSIDGFIPRRPISPHASARGTAGIGRTEHAAKGLQHGAPEPSQATTLRPDATHGLAQQDIAAVLNDIDSQEANQPTDKKSRRRLKFSKKTTKRIVIAILLILLAVGLYVGIKTLIASGNIFRGDLLGLMQSAPLKTDANGRSNVLVFGTSEDNFEGGVQHDGAYLTDSIMVVSIHQEDNNAYMVSIPRDLWVQYGAACNAGYEGKINELYGCYSQNGENEEAGAEAFRKKVSEVVGLDIQYFAHLNYTVVEQAVDAVGGVSVEIDSDDPRGIYDPNFDWRCQYQCNYVKYPNGPTGTMDGEHALALARARNANGGYGLQRSNFDREQYQQKIIRALAEKAVSAGTVTNLGKVTSLIDALGDNLRTNFQTSEIRTLMRLAQDIPQDQMISVDLATEDEPAVVNDSNGGISIVRPVSGLYDYSSIKSYVRKQFMGTDPVVQEAAKIGVYNGTTTSGVAQTVADELMEQNLNIIDIGNAPEGSYNAYEIYDLTGNKPSTKAQLEARFGVTARTTTPPLSIPGLDFVVVVGRAPTSQ